MSTATVQRPTQVTDSRSQVAVGLRRFRPRLALGYQRELHALVTRLRAAPLAGVTEILAAAVEAADARYEDLAVEGLGPTDLLPTLQWATALRVLRDLSSQGWTFYADDEGILLNSPGTQQLLAADPEREKEALRRSFAFAREAQLNDATTSRFVLTMERRGIDRVLADGAELAERLRTRGVEAIQPELELIEPRAKDSVTGLALQDIWRYARLFWSIPYQSTPGRNMFYLVRDGAIDSRPVIGIAALGNPVLGLAQRDDYAGWSADGFGATLQRLDPAGRSRLAACLMAVVGSGLEEVFADDLQAEALDDWRLEVTRLERLAGDSADERLRGLDTEDDERSPEYRLIRAAHTLVSKGRQDEIDWTSVAQTHLYRRKRAATRADLLRAHETLREFGLPGDVEGLEAALETDAGRRALEIALRRIKQNVIASSVMEIITCGAVPPYRDVLAGKLISLLLLSRRVVDDYEAKYSQQVSLIASALGAEPVTRPTRLALLTTSSLYAVGSSQYNRLKLSVDDESVSYRRIGVTDSFGTVHFAPDTVASLSQVARLVDLNRRRINNLFGEGTSPKLRLIRSGLEALGLNPEVFLKHHSPRLLYAAPLCSNIEDVLLGLTDEPKYVLPDGQASTDLIIGHWRDRWLAGRLKRPEVLERIDNERRDHFLLSGQLSPEAHGGGSGRAPEAAMLSRGATLPAATSQSDDATFVERLYRSTNSFADRLSQDELEAIHVDLGVDGYLLDEASRKKQIVVTGNPGDGKTHLIERLRFQLEAEGAEVITDANACSDEDTLDMWARCKQEGRPFVLAINEWPLYVLQRLARTRDFTAVDEALRQVRRARFFVEAQVPEEPQDDVITIDLSLRNLLAPSVVSRVVERLTDDRFYVGLNEQDPMRLNRRALQDPQVIERLCAVLDLVSVRLGHITMRQLVGFSAYLLSAGQSAAERLKAGQDATGLSYSNLGFEGGVGTLFDAVRHVLDPAAMTHPIWDERLWLGELDAGDWLWEAPSGALALPDSEREAGFRAVKRQFFFEHVSGGRLIDLKPRDEVEFEATLVEGAAGKTGLVRDLVLALNRFYEPDFPEKDRDRLLLWQSHRYDVRAPKAFVSLRDLPHQQLRVEPLRYADWVERWLPPEQQKRRSFALVAYDASGSDVALLEIDRELYLTLLEAQRGLGRSSWSRTATRRITRFIDRIDRALETKTGVEDLRVRNVDTDLDERFEIQRQPSRYRV